MYNCYPVLILHSVYDCWHHRPHFITSIIDVLPRHNNTKQAMLHKRHAHLQLLQHYYQPQRYKYSSCILYIIIISPSMKEGTDVLLF